MTTPPGDTIRRLALALVPALLAACGGGDDGRDGPPPFSCSVAAQQAWLGDYMDAWYFWYRLVPRPDPADHASLDAYFQAWLYTGTDARFPADRWSYRQTTESFNRFFGDGQSLGYGVAVAGIEVSGRPDLPLKVRYVEPASDAAARGVVRGDQVLAINGRSAAELIAADDFSLLSPERAGEQIVLRLRNGGAERTLTLTAGVFALTPVPARAVVSSPLGRRLGYVHVKEMVSQAEAPLEAAFAQFRAAGIDGLVLDLRYNGGGLVSTASRLASYVAGSRGAGFTFAELLYNDQRAAANNQTYRFESLASAAGVARVFVLAGPRTCSASEQVINGLRGIGIDVVAIGDTTCGKPVGFLPASDGCGTTYNVVNFESVNARFEGRYFDGFDATCAVAEDPARPLAAPDEPLLAAALQFADSGNCPAAGLSRLPSKPGRATPAHRLEPGEGRGMIAR
jgi:carboxyl-terminal processing protease